MALIETTKNTNEKGRETMKVKFTTGNGKTSVVDGKIISRTGGALACVELSTYGGSIIYSVTHMLTGAAIRSIFKTPGEAEKFARGFYHQCNDFEKLQLKTQSVEKIHTL